MNDLPELPRAAWMRVIRMTFLMTLVSSVLSVAAAQSIMLVLSEGLDLAGVVASFVLPILLGGPAMFYHLLRGEKLRLANQRLQIMASTDWLTGCLNRRAFTSLVSGHLQDAGAPSTSIDGAFLVIDADDFKVINDLFGHDRGDEALQMMVAAIKQNIRAGDLVGRIGGEEFGVYLKGAGYDTAAIVTERIRISISSLRLSTHTASHPLSVSIGGVVFQGVTGFAELFRLADQGLYDAKKAGRNRVALKRIPDAERQFPTQSAAA